jgi:Ser/Thr protein kinase RdoA (MazF antagonist)
VVTESTIHQAAQQFGLQNVALIESFSEGLIHHTYKVQSTAGNALIIQAINTQVFQHPETIISNYCTLYHHLQKKQFIIPAPIMAVNGAWYWEDVGGAIWRAQEFISNSCTEKMITSEKAFRAAQCFASFASALNDLDTNLIEATIPKFHDLHFRYDQLQIGIEQASQDRLAKASEVINTITRNQELLHFYDSIQRDADYKKRIMHHDCKLSNILFHHETHIAICPVDLDTTMPGFFFSDPGDMIRSMVPNQDENSTDWNTLAIKKEIYTSTIAGYQSGIGDVLTEKENNHLHYSGLLMMYMQAIRFLTDYLSNDRYYQISYADQNLNRAKNQLLFLEKLKLFLKEEYGF